MIGKRIALLKQLLKKRVFILDGAMGTMFHNYNLKESDYRGKYFAKHRCQLTGNYDILSLTCPSVVEDIHRAYLKAGADIIESNTFNGSSVSQADYQLEQRVYDMNLTSAQLARKMADEFSANCPDKPRFVAGVLGPTNRICLKKYTTLDNNLKTITFEELSQAYLEQIKGLVDGGIDMVMIETAYNLSNAEAAVDAISKYKKRYQLELPVWVSVTINNINGRILSGQTLGEFVTIFNQNNPFCLGLNCSWGVETLCSSLKILSKMPDTFASVHPNAGLPNKLGKYNETPAHMASVLKKFANNGLLNIAGGCCGTTPEHIKAIADALHGIPPRKVKIP